MYSCDDVDSITVHSELSEGSVESRDLNVYCGMRRPPMLMSSSTRMELVFVAGPQTDHSVRGFALVYKFVTGTQVLTVLIIVIFIESSDVFSLYLFDLWKKTARDIEITSIITYWAWAFQRPPNELPNRTYSPYLGGV